MIAKQDDSVLVTNTRGARKCNTESIQEVQNLRREQLGIVAAISNTYSTPAQVILHTHPLQFLVDVEMTVLDDNTGEVLQYRHLIAKPKYENRVGVFFQK